MDRRECMISSVFSGCYCLKSLKNIDKNNSDMIYIDGKATEAPLIAPNMPMFGQVIGIYIRKYIVEYNIEYKITYSGELDTYILYARFGK